MRLVVEADGGARGNPGPAGYGAVVRDARTGEVLAEVFDYLGTTTNNVAEYRGLIAGLQAARAVDASAEVAVRMDSKLVVEQMRGSWKVKHPGLRPLALEANGLARSFSAVSFEWIPRERNKAADRLANEAMDRRSGGTTRETEPGPEPSPSGAELGAPTRTLLLRHGETAASVGAWVNGAADEPLTTGGRREAAAVARALAKGEPVHAIVSSPLGRARETADIVAQELHLPVREDADLREADFGAWEGLTMGEVLERFPEELRGLASDPSTAPPGGESLLELRRRVLAARDRLLAGYLERTVLVVAHGMVLAVLVSIALDAPVGTAMRLRMETTALSAVEWYADGFARLALGCQCDRK